MLLAVSFQQFADVSVFGVARQSLERLINDSLGATSLIYETAVALVRKRVPSPEASGRSSPSRVS
jgi:hypothetical protein